MTYPEEERRRSMLTDRDIEILAKLIKGGEKKILGFRVPELVMICGVLLSVFAFYIRTNDAIVRLTKLGEYTQGFMTNSDLHHTEVLGTRFVQGRPDNPNFDPSRIRELLHGQSKGN